MEEIPRMQREWNQCFGCEEPTRSKRRCGACFHAFYCDAKCQKKGWSLHKRHCYPLERALVMNARNKALHEALEYNLLQEYKAMLSFLEDSPVAQNTLYRRARRSIYEGIIGMIMLDPVAGDLPPGKEEEWDKLCALIIEGGRLLNQEGGMDSMHSPLVFCFIPDRYHKDIDLMWHGIGKWRG